MHTHLHLWVEVVRPAAANLSRDACSAYTRQENNGRTSGKDGGIADEAYGSHGAHAIGVRAGRSTCEHKKRVIVADDEGLVDFADAKVSSRLAGDACDVLWVWHIYVPRIVRDRFADVDGEFLSVDRLKLVAFPGSDSLSGRGICAGRCCGTLRRVDSDHNICCHHALSTAGRLLQTPQQRE
jgi:hypothetical protein